MGINTQALEDLHVRNIQIISGIRPAGRTVDNSGTGRSHHGFFYIWSGEAQFFAEDKQTVTVSEGELLLIPKGYRYKMQYTAPSTTFVLVDLDMYAPGGQETALTDELMILAKDDEGGHIARIMTSFELCGVSKNIRATLRKKELLYRLLGFLYQTDTLLSAPAQGDTRILAGTRLLEQSYLENLPIARFAEACSLSISAFRALFRQQYGMSPLQYRNRLRIDRAATLLSEGSCTVSEAAYACGFENVGYFCRYYKRITGTVPSAAKKRNS